MGENVILSVQDVTKRFVNVVALNQVSFDIYKGQVHGIVGENGAGKSTLMKILSGVYKKDKGIIYFDGQEMKVKGPTESLNLGLAIIYQELNLVNQMTVGENIFLGRFREIGGLKKIHAKARELLDSIGSHIDTYSPVEDLPVAEKQMVEICKALSYNSKLIIMDEPSTTLTTEEMNRLKEIIKDLKSKGITIIYISHKLDEIFELCDRVTVMRDGNVISTRNVEELTRPTMIAEMVGRSIENEYPERASKIGETILEVKNIRTNKLHDVGFTAKKGEILGFVGLVGAGRTETMRAIFGADKIQNGEVYLEGRKLDIKSPRDAIAAGFGFITEDRKEEGLLLNFPVGTNITMASFPNFTVGGLLNKAREKEIIERQIKALDVKTPNADIYITYLSGGNQQKCLVARWLETSPKILIMDEPTRGIDVGAKYEIYVLMKKFAEAGGTVLMISSELPEVLNMSNRVIVLSDGKVVGEYDPETTSDEKILAAALGEEVTE
ncbi:MAG: sugar ABC transporter ATP-binding protein [Eubacteriales bacterium]|nr:sugar ABC transporter ATP-binding protein [Eubacteriales bacterium]